MTSELGLPDVVGSQADAPGRSHPPPAPRVTPEPAPSDTVLIVTGVVAGVIGTLMLLWFWRRVVRRRP